MIRLENVLKMSLQEVLKTSFGIILGLILRQYRMKKSLKKLYGGEQNNLLSNGFVQVSRRKIILNGERNALVNTLFFSIKSFITIKYDTGSGGAFSDIYNGVQ